MRWRFLSAIMNGVEVYSRTSHTRALADVALRSALRFRSISPSWAA